MKKYIIILLIIATASISLKAQQFALYSQYMHNRYALNPAVAGTSDGVIIGASYRQMWTGLQNAPSISTLSGHTSIADNMGVGGRIFNISTGPQSQTGFEGTYAYRFNINDDIKLSLGVSAILAQYSLDKTKLDMKNPDDQALNSGTENLIVPDANFGVYMYAEKYYFGIVAAQLIPLKADYKSAYLENKQERHYFVHGGYKFDISDNFGIEPSVLFRYIEAGALQLDVNLKFSIMKMFWVGGSYRLNDAAIAMFGVQTDRIMFGYSYDYTLSEIGDFSNGSHELVLILKIGGNSGVSLF